MDKLIYTAMSGAKQAFLQQAGVAQNPPMPARPAIARWSIASARCRCRATGWRRALTVNALGGRFPFQQGPLM